MITKAEIAVNLMTIRTANFTRLVNFKNSLYSRGKKGNVLPEPSLDKAGA